MSSPSVRTGAGLEQVRARLRTLPGRFRRESANGLSAEWELRIDGARFAIIVGDHRCEVREGPAAAPHSIIATEPATWLDIDAGAITGGQAFLDRRFAASGNLDLAVRLQTLFRPYRRARRPTDLDQLEVRAGGIGWSYYQVGSGPPLLLLHGLGGTKITWLPLLAELGRYHRVIVPDLPGHGESAKPRTDYTPRFYARSVRQLMDAVEVDRVVVVGNSLGGRIAIEMARRSPGRVAALGLLGPSLPGLRWRHLAGLTRVIPTEVGGIPFPLRERWMRLAIQRLFARPGSLPEGSYEAAAHEFVRIYRDPRARMAFFSSLRHIVTERPGPFFSSLGTIRQPASVIFGESDRLVPPRLGMRLAQGLPNAQLVMLPDVGHVPQVEATAATIDALAPVLGRVR